MTLGSFSLGSYEDYDRNSCACGCGRKARPGLQPRFFDGACRERWIATLAIPIADDQAEPADPAPAVELRDDAGQPAAVVTFDQPVTTEQVEEIRASLDESTGRLAVEVSRPRQPSLKQRIADWVRTSVRRAERDESESWRRLWSALDDHE